MVLVLRRRLKSVGRQQHEEKVRSSSTVPSLLKHLQVTAMDEAVINTWRQHMEPVTPSQLTTCNLFTRVNKSHVQVQTSKQKLISYS